MASKLAKLEQETITNSLEIVHHKVRLLMEVWKMFFDEICYLDYLTSLPSSIEQFLGEIYCLTMSFCVRKTQRIRELQAELFELRRVLGVTTNGGEVPHGGGAGGSGGGGDDDDDDDDDWERGHMSLDRKLTQLQQRINALRQQTDDRKRLMDEFTREETILLTDLGEAAPPHEPLCAHPDTGRLPDAQKMAQFGDYLSRLRTEKQKRIATRDKLQADIRTKAQQLDWVPRKERHRQLVNEQTLIPSLGNLSELQHLDFVLSGLLERKRQQEDNQQEEVDKRSPNEQKPPEQEQHEPMSAPSPEPQPTKTPKNQQSSPVGGTQTPPPPPPPPSPSAELDPNATTATGGLFDRTIEAYMQGEAESGRPTAVREHIVEEMFRHVRASINVWWERCLISPNERQQCKVLYTNQLDEDAFIAHIEQQKLLKSYYHENEPIFTLIYHWAELWNRGLLLEQQAAKQRQAKPTAKDGKELREAKYYLAQLEKQLESKCREFEQRCQVKFTMFGMPVMHVLYLVREKREELKLPASCKIEKRRAGVTTTGEQQLPETTAQELSRLLDGLMVTNKRNPPDDAVTTQHTQLDALLAAVDPTQPGDVAGDGASDSDDSNHGEDGEGGAGGSSSGGEVEQQDRDDELLEEAFASAAAITTVR